MAPSSSEAPRVLRQPGEAVAILDPMRLRLLRHLEFPASAASVARRLHLPRQQVNYHLRELERRGLVRLVRERKVGNCTERLVQAVARKFVLSQEVLGPLAAEPTSVPDAEVRIRATFETGEAAESFLAELSEEAVRLAAKHGQDREARPHDHVVLIAIHPTRARRKLPDPQVRE